MQTPIQTRGIVNSTAISIQIDDAPGQDITARHTGNDSLTAQLIDARNLTRPVELEREESDDESEIVQEIKPGPSYKLGGDEDPVHVYLRDMAGRPLLTREGEIKIARRIEGGQQRVLKALSRSPVTIQALLAVAVSFKLGETNIREVVSFDDSEEAVAETADERLQSTLDRLNQIKRSYTRALKLGERLAAEPKRSSRRAALKVKLA